jgi:hypothetical protein
MNKLGLSDFHEANLRLLAENGRRIPDDYEKFNMSTYRDGGAYSDSEAVSVPFKDGCGSSACMVGHAPFLGISLPIKGETWDEYGIRVFGLEACEKVYQFMFGSEWVEEDNNARACASRILFALDQTREYFVDADEVYDIEYPLLDALPENDYVSKLLEQVQV